MQVGQYVAKPFNIDAVRVTDDNFDEVVKWCGGEYVEPDATDSDGRPYIRVDVKLPLGPRQTKAFIGDWVLKAKGGFKVYTDRAFLSGFNKKKPAKPDTIVQNITTHNVYNTVPDAAKDSPRITVTDNPDDSPEQQV